MIDPSTLPVTEHGPLRYLLRVPEHAPTPRPVLVFLHGYDEGAPMAIHEALTLTGRCALATRPMR